jgi:hypothetical protein
VRSDLLKPFLIEWCRTYELVLVSKIDSRIATVPDHLRIPDHVFRAEMEAYSDTVLAQLTPNARTLGLSPEERLREALDLIQRALQRNGA